MDSSINKRNYTLDIARIFAVLAVVMLHCSAGFVSDYKIYTAEFILGNLFDSIARVGVPLFLMISGALFLDENKEVTLKGILSKNVKNLAIITVIWAVIYSLAHNVAFPLLTGGSVSIRRVLVDTVTGHYHMWYLYMIIGLYIITPFLKKFVCRENAKMVLFFIMISFAAQFLLPTIDKLCIRYLGIDYIGIWVESFHLDFFGGYITYFLAGWYIVHVGIKQKYVRYSIYALGLMSLLFIIFYVQLSGDYTTAYENVGAPVFVYAVSVFLALNNIKFNLKEKTAKKLEKLSKLTFGVYIVHALVLTVFGRVLPYSNNCVLYIALCFATVLCVSFLGAYIMSKIPLIKKLIKA